MWSFKALDKSMREISVLKTTTAVKNTFRTKSRHIQFIPRSLERAGGGRGKVTTLEFLALNFCCLNDCQKLWSNCTCSLFFNTYFDAN